MTPMPDAEIRLKKMVAALRENQYRITPQRLAILKVGFAVVAGEIKALAKQTAEATESITRMITGIQRIHRHDCGSNRGCFRNHLR